VCAYEIAGSESEEIRNRKRKKKWIKRTEKAKYRTKLKHTRRSLRAEERKLDEQNRRKIRKREEFSLLGCDTV
jgi:hypothetical protein